MEDNTVGACEEDLSCGQTMNCNAEDNTGYSDVDYEEISLTLERKISRKSKECLTNKQATLLTAMKNTTS